MAPSHRKETVGKRKTTESSTPGDRKIERRKRCITHPGLDIRASSTSAFKEPSSKFEASTRTRINISWDNRSYPRSMQRRGLMSHAHPCLELPGGKLRLHSFSAKRQRDKKSQLSSSMRAKLGPQEPGRSRPPVATTGAPRLTRGSLQWCRTYLRIVTP
ncbi:hypothetical protein CK203_017761 [Vitis vinifera]|uniref:Uncharacterized protein n=1 Tax=Vitis vinifera TaxID=29760 RepID=A0A438JGV3_VITVI|nr:hypothetical protein CK203_017761 [Vitis vinifera]